MFEKDKLGVPKERPERRGLAAGVIVVGQRIKFGRNIPRKDDSSQSLEEFSESTEKLDTRFIQDPYGNLKEEGGWADLGPLPSRQTDRS